MKFLIAFIIVGLMSTVARSAPIDDVPAWAQRFAQAALKTDTAALADMVQGAAAPGLSVSGMPQIFQAVKNNVGDQTGIFAEQFDEKDIGTFLKRINIAVSYPKGLIFYSVTIRRVDGGWLLYGIKVDGNINNIINQPWPS